MHPLAAKLKVFKAIRRLPSDDLEALLIFLNYDYGGSKKDDVLDWIQFAKDEDNAEQNATKTSQSNSPEANQGDAGTGSLPKTDPAT